MTSEFTTLQVEFASMLSETPAKRRRDEFWLIRFEKDLLREVATRLILERWTGFWSMTKTCHIEAKVLGRKARL